MIQFQNVTCADINTQEILDGFKKDAFDYNDTEIYNQTDATGNVDISTLTVSDTLDTSELATLNPNTTTDEELRTVFCKDFARVAKSYEESLVVPLPIPEQENRSEYKNVISIGAVLFIILLLVTSIVRNW